MEYIIILPCEFDLGEWFNIGIDFWPQHITANHRETRDEVILINLKRFAINLDNRYIREYKVTQTHRGFIEIKIIV
jgi:hypothetical protein